MNNNTEASKDCFVIMPIGEENSETRRRSDQVLKHIIKPAAESCGYCAIRADEIDKPGLITSQVIQRVINDPLVIADLSETNPNVFYELAIRHAIRRPMVQIIEKGQRIPFDVAGTRTIYVDHKDMDSVFSAKEEIVKQIKQLEINPGDLETPISVSNDLQILKKSDNPKDRGIADVLSFLSDMRAEQRKIGDIADKELTEKFSTILKRIDIYLSEANNLNPRRRFSNAYIARMNLDVLQGDAIEMGLALPIALAASAFRDIVPWIYEVGMEAYRQQLSGTQDSADRALKEFQTALRYSDHPVMRDIYRNDKELMFLKEEIDVFVNEYISKRQNMIAKNRQRLK